MNSWAWWRSTRGSRTHDTRGKPALPAAPNETMIGMREVALTDEQRQSEASTFAACLATILEVPLAAVPEPHPGRGPATGWLMSLGWAAWALAWLRLPTPPRSHGLVPGWRGSNRQAKKGGAGL